MDVFMLNRCNFDFLFSRNFYYLLFSSIKIAGFKVFFIGFITQPSLTGTINFYARGTREQFYDYLLKKKLDKLTRVHIFFDITAILSVS